MVAKVTGERQLDFRQILKLQFDEYESETKRLVQGLTDEERRFMPSGDSHHIDFALWHAIRAEDVLLNLGAREQDQTWTNEGWSDRLGIPAEDLGLGYSAEQVRGMPPTPIDLLLAYYDAVRKVTLEYVATVDPDELDERCPFEPLHTQLPGITKGGVLAHMVVEPAQHLGQIGYIRGIVRGLNG